MKRIIAIALLATTTTCAILVSATVKIGPVLAEDSNRLSAPERRTKATSASDLPTRSEARSRAQLLHETVTAMLHVVHHRYYREDEGLPIPAAVFKDVFRELAERQHVELRWLAVDAQPMNVGHQARDDFEKDAVRAITSGEEDFESAENGVYRRVAAIALTSECLKCHLPNRTSTRTRSAGLTIAMPVKQE